MSQREVKGNLKATPSSYSIGLTMPSRQCIYSAFQGLIHAITVRGASSSVTKWLQDICQSQELAESNPMVALS